MSSLILNAGLSSAITVNCQRLGKSVPRYVGGRTDSNNGTERSTIRGQKKVIPVSVSPVDTATEASIQAAAYNGAQIPCSGDILGNIQTICSLDVASEMMPGLPGFFTMTLTLFEVNASVILARYAPGDTITGETFTRATAAFYVNIFGTPTVAGINVKRDSHYNTAGGTRSLLLEGAATNPLIQTVTLANAAWTKVSMTPTAGIADPSGGTQATTLTATAPNAQVFQSLAAGASIVRTTSCWIKRRAGTGTVSLQTPLDATHVVTLTSSWQRFTATAPAGTARIFDIIISTSGDAIDVWAPQIDDLPFASSEILTTTVAVTRAADSYSFPFTVPPQEMSVYAKFMEMGTTGVTDGRIFEIGSSADVSPRLFTFASGGLYSVFHGTAAGGVVAALAAAPAIGTVAELDTRLFGDGSVDLTQSINSAASTAAAQTSALALATAWSGQLVWFNSVGSSNVGYVAIHSFKILAGARSLAEMRAA